MKFDLTKQLIGLDGQPATQIVETSIDLTTGRPKGYKEEPLTVGMVLKTALNAQKQGVETPLDKLIQRGKWIMSINKGVSPDFKVEEQAEIKKLCQDAGFAPIVIAQINELIESKGK